MLHAFQVRDGVVVIMKNSLLLIATDNHMVERFVGLDSGVAAMERELVGDKRLGLNAGSVHVPASDPRAATSSMIGSGIMP